MFKLWKLAIRDLGRNKRRSSLSLLAVALGVALLVVTSGLMEGSIWGSVESNIRVRTAHVQVREQSYEADRISLKWEHLLDDPQQVVAQAQALPEVRYATPVLWASGILAAGQESVGVQVTGLDPLSEFSAPFREGTVAGQFLAAEDRGGIVIGRRLAESLDVTVGEDISLMVNTSDEEPDEAILTVRGLYDTGHPVYDETTVFLPLAKAQAFTRAGERASAVLVLLEDKEDTDAVANSLQGPGREVLTWRDLAQAILGAVETSKGLIYLMYLIVLAVVAVVIANTLLMSVFERTREMGILAALGMRGRQVMVTFVVQAALLALVGIVLGLCLGSLGVYYLSTQGLDIGGAAQMATAEVAYGERLYARFVPVEMAQLSVATFVITLLASLYPAWFAARMEPIEALRAL
jgi:ABC-type lipoprotein release transport system permease subunit